MFCTSGDSNTYKFTGKERDPETGNDYFGARYYTSNEGRFLTPDWDAKPTTVPYATFGDPQTLNLYAYVENGPVDRVDADGHADTGQSGTANQPTSPGSTCAAAWTLECLTTWHNDNPGVGSGDQTASSDLTTEQSASDAQHQQARKRGLKAAWTGVGCRLSMGP